MVKRVFPAVLLVAALFMLSATSEPVADFKYVGAAKCKTCHNKPPKGAQFKKWSEGPHAKSMESLKGDEKKDPKCLKCHSTAAAVDASLLQGLKVEEGVTCEGCHGPGSAYKSLPIMRDPEKAKANGLIVADDKLCKTCHNEESPTFKGFDYDKYWAEINHDDPTTK